MDGGRYRFSARMDDGVRVWINNHFVIDDWQDGSVRLPFVDLNLAGGSPNKTEVALSNTDSDDD